MRGNRGVCKKCGKKELLNTLRALKRSGLRKTVDARLREFARAGEKDSRTIFSELCFCILTANFNAERSIEMQKKIGNGFLKLPEKKLAEKLKELGHRYPNARARYIVEARKHAQSLKRIILRFKHEKEAREWVVKNVKGFGWKEASHFLRNIGFSNIAIVDFHIIDVLKRHCLIGACGSTLTKKRYLGAEKALERLANKAKMSLAELDLYLWFIETGKVLK